MISLSTVAAGHVASVRKPAARLPGSDGGRSTDNRDEFLARCSQFDPGALEGCRIGVLRFRELLHTGRFDACARVHDNDLLANIVDQRQIVRNEKNGQSRRQ